MKQGTKLGPDLIQAMRETLAHVKGEGPAIVRTAKGDGCAFWNYRIMRHVSPSGSFDAIHEVFYDAAGKVIDWTKSPVAPTHDLSDPDASLAEDLRQMGEALERSILDYGTGAEIA